MRLVSVEEQIQLNGQTKVINRNTLNFTLAKGLQARGRAHDSRSNAGQRPPPVHVSVPNMQTGDLHWPTNQCSGVGLQLSLSQTNPSAVLSAKLSGKGWSLRHDSPTKARTVNLMLAAGAAKCCDE